MKGSVYVICDNKQDFSDNKPIEAMSLNAHTNCLSKTQVTSTVGLKGGSSCDVSAQLIAKHVY